MKVLSFLKIAAVPTFMLVGISVLAPAQAAVGNWTGSNNGPTIYQTNWYYDSGTATPPAYVPSTATTTSVSWQLNLSYYPSGTNAWMHFYDSGYLALGSTSGLQTLVGVPAKQTMGFTFNVLQATTHILTPTVYGGGHQFNINYQY